MARLTLHNVSKQFSEQRVINQLDLSIEPGSFVALLGPSGCGKSTILRMLAGFETVTSGEIRHGGRCLSSEQQHVPTEARNFGMVFQSYALWPHMTVAENVGYPLKIQKIKGAVKNQRIFDALAVVELEDYANRLPSQLSGGQRQRVALARSLVTEPDVVLFDEPLANLDRHLRATMEDTFRAFHKRTKATIVYVTHDQSEAMSLADHIAVLNKGKLVQWATPEELYNTPKNAWLANFIGRGSVLNVASIEPLQYVKTDTLHRIVQSHDPSIDSSSVLVRPHDIQFVEAGVNALSVRVRTCIFRGERYDIELTMSNGQLILAYSDFAMAQGSQHYIRITQAWALEGES